MHCRTKTRVRDTAGDHNTVIHQDEEITATEGVATLEVDLTAGKTEEETALKEETLLTEASLQTDTREETPEGAQDPLHQGVSDSKEIISVGTVTSRAT